MQVLLSIKKKRANDQPQLPSGVLLRTARPTDSSTSILTARYCVWGEKSKAVTRTADTPRLFRKILRNCLIVVLILGRGRQIQPFKREGFLTPVSCQFSMYYVSEDTLCSFSSSLFRGCSCERSPRRTVAPVPQCSPGCQMSFVSRKDHPEMHRTMLYGAWKYAFCSLALIKD